jgi:hypothetical protein
MGEKLFVVLVESYFIRGIGPPRDLDPHFEFRTQLGPRTVKRITGRTTSIVAISFAHVKLARTLATTIP